MTEETVTLKVPYEKFINILTYYSWNVMEYVKNPPKSIIAYALEFDNEGLPSLKLNKEIINTAIQVISELEGSERDFMTEPLMNELSFAMKKQKKTLSNKNEIKKQLIDNGKFKTLNLLEKLK